MRVYTAFCAANFGRLSIVSKMTNTAARPDLIDAVTISEVFDDFFELLGSKSEKRGLGGCYQAN